MKTTWPGYTQALPQIFNLFLIPYLFKAIQEFKISDPKKSFDHPRHLKSGVPPLEINITLLSLVILS